MRIKIGKRVLDQLKRLPDCVLIGGGDTSEKRDQGAEVLVKRGMCACHMRNLGVCITPEVRPEVQKSNFNLFEFLNLGLSEPGKILWGTLLDVDCPLFEREGRNWSNLNEYARFTIMILLLRVLQLRNERREDFVGPYYRAGRTGIITGEDYPGFISELIELKLISDSVSMCDYTEETPQAETLFWHEVWQMIIEFFGVRQERQDVFQMFDIFLRRMITWAYLSLNGELISYDQLGFSSLEDSARNMMDILLRVSATILHQPADQLKEKGNLAKFIENRMLGILLNTIYRGIPFTDQSTTNLFFDPRAVADEVFFIAFDCRTEGALTIPQASRKYFCQKQQREMRQHHVFGSEYEIKMPLTEFITKCMEAVRREDEYLERQRSQPPFFDQVDTMQSFRRVAIEEEIVRELLSRGKPYFRSQQFGHKVKFFLTNQRRVELEGVCFDDNNREYRRFLFINPQKANEAVVKLQAAGLVEAQSESESESTLHQFSFFKYYDMTVMVKRSAFQEPESGSTPSDSNTFRI